MIWVRRTLVAAAVALVLVGTGYAGYAWSQSQYFVKASDGYVAVWQGVDQSLGPISLSHVDSVSDVPLSDLPTYVQDLVRTGTPIGSRADAEARMTTLRQTAVGCRGAGRRRHPLRPGARDRPERLDDEPHHDGIDHLGEHPDAGRHAHHHRRRPHRSAVPTLPNGPNPSITIGSTP